MMLLRIIVLLPLIISLVGCSAGQRLPRPPQREIVGEARREILAVHRERASQLVTFRALYRTEVLSDEGRAQGRTSIVSKLPDRLRCEVFPPTGAYTLQRLLVNGPRLYGYDATTGETYRGETSVKQVRRFIGIALDSEELIQLLAGVPALQSIPEEQIEVRQRLGAEVYHIVIPARGRQYIFRSENHELSEAELIDQFSKRVALHLSIEKSQAIPPFVVPSALSFSIDQGEVSLRLAAQRADMNVEIADALFSIE